MNVSERRLRGATVLLGTMDACTGASLIAAPLVTLGLLQIPAPAAEALIFLRWIGVFVVSVGVMTLDAAFRGRERWVAVLQITAGVRWAVAAFCAAAIFAGSLPAAWWGVAVADFLTGGVQAWIVARSRRLHANPEAQS